MVELSPKQAWYTGSTKQVVISLQVRTGRGPVYFCFSQSEKWLSLPENKGIRGGGPNTRPAEFTQSFSPTGVTAPTHPESLHEPGVSTAQPSSAGAPALRVTHLVRRRGGRVTVRAAAASDGANANMDGAGGRARTYQADRALVVNHRPAASRRRHGRGPVLVRAGAGRRPPIVRAAVPGAGAGSVACAHRPINPLMPRAPRPRPVLHYERPFTNMAQRMAARHPPNSHVRRGIAG